MRMSRADGFLNVDLEVGASTRAQLAPLLAVFESSMVELFRGRMRGLYRAHYEVSACNENARDTIHMFADAIDGLSRSARRAWNGAKVREFNIGVELERGVASIQFALDNATVRRVASLGGRIAVTAYQQAAMKTASSRARAKVG